MGHYVEEWEHMTASVDDLTTALGQGWEPYASTLYPTLAYFGSDMTWRVNEVAPPYVLHHLKRRTGRRVRVADE